MSTGRSHADSYQVDLGLPESVCGVVLRQMHLVQRSRWTGDVFLQVFVSLIKISVQSGIGANTILCAQTALTRDRPSRTNNGPGLVNERI
jgi:hypothetical protein